MSSYVDLGTEELRVSEKKKVVARRTMYGGKERIDLRFWSYYQGKWIPLKAQGIFLETETLREMIPKLQSLVGL